LSTLTNHVLLMDSALLNHQFHTILPFRPRSGCRPARQREQLCCRDNGAHRVRWIAPAGIRQCVAAAFSIPEFGARGPACPYLRVFCWLRRLSWIGWCRPMCLCPSVISDRPARCLLRIVRPRDPQGRCCFLLHAARGPSRTIFALAIRQSESRIADRLDQLQILSALQVIPKPQNCFNRLTVPRVNGEYEQTNPSG